jgi:hypothetical protein
MRFRSLRAPEFRDAAESAVHHDNLGGGHDGHA